LVLFGPYSVKVAICLWDSAPSAHEPVCQFARAVLQASRAHSEQTSVPLETYERTHNANLLFANTKRSAASHTCSKVRPQMRVPDTAVHPFDVGKVALRKITVATTAELTTNTCLAESKASSQSETTTATASRPDCVDDVVLLGDDASGSGSWKPPLSTLSFPVKLEIHGHGVSTRSMPP